MDAETINESLQYREILILHDDIKAAFKIASDIFRNFWKVSVSNERYKDWITDLDPVTAMDYGDNLFSGKLSKPHLKYSGIKGSELYVLFVDDLDKLEETEELFSHIANVENRIQVSKIVILSTNESSIAKCNIRCFDIRNHETECEVSATKEKPECLTIELINEKFGDYISTLNNYALESNIKYDEDEEIFYQADGKEIPDGELDFLTGHQACVVSWLESLDLDNGITPPTQNNVKSRNKKLPIPKKDGKYNKYTVLKYWFVWKALRKTSK